MSRKSSAHRYPAYLVGHTSGYYFRITVPLDLQHLVQLKELRYSLQTGFLGEAKYRAGRMASFVKWLFRDMRRGGRMKELTGEAIQNILGTHLRTVLEDVEYRRITEPRINEEQYNLKLNTLGILISDCLEQLALNDYRDYTHVADSILEENKLSADRSSYLYKKLCRELIKTSIKALRFEEELYAPVNELDVRNHQPNPATDSSSPQAPDEPAELLSKVIGGYVVEQEQGGNWTSKTKEEFIAIMSTMTEALGDVPVKTISHQRIRGYKETLMKLPANRSKIPTYRGKTIPELLKMEIKKPMSVSNVNKYLNRASSLFKWAVKNGFMDKNPAEGMQIRKSRRDDELRDEFKADDFRKIFHSKNYLKDSYRNSYCFWAPVLGLFTGCRLEEICQLHLNDIRQEREIWVLDINNEGAKKIKTPAGIRLVPLHPFLVDDLKLPRYVEYLKEQGHTRLFPELTQRRDGYGQTVSKWFSRYKKVCGVRAEDKNKDFHSFRHTFINALKQRNIEPIMIYELVGHETGSKSMTLGRYGKRYSVEILYDKVIRNLSFDVDLEHLKKSSFVKT